MAIRYFALVYGIVFLLVGIAGFVPGFVAPYDPSHPELAVNSGAGLLFGLFPVNLLHNLVHAAFGVWGILAWRSLGASRAYARAVAVVYGVFVLLGIIPGFMTLFGLVPLHGHGVWLHVLLAAVAAYFGFAHKVSRPISTTGTPGGRYERHGGSSAARGGAATGTGTAGGSYAPGSQAGTAGGHAAGPQSGGPGGHYAPGGAATPGSNTAGTSGAAGGTGTGTTGTPPAGGTGNSGGSGSSHRTNRM